MKLLFEIDPRKFKKLQVQEANGLFMIINNDGEMIYSHTARSGGWGNGPMPTGEYKLTGYSDQTGDAYSQYGLGWAVYLEPQFKTDRTGLWIHPDGNIEGSLGCLVLPFASLDDNLRCRNLLRDIIEKGTTYLTVYQLSIPQGV